MVSLVTRFVQKTCRWDAAGPDPPRYDPLASKVRILRSAEATGPPSTVGPASTHTRVGALGSALPVLWVALNQTGCGGNGPGGGGRVVKLFQSKGSSENTKICWLVLPLPV